MPQRTNRGCTCGNTARCRVCVKAILPVVARESRPVARRTGVGAVAKPEPAAQ